MYNMFIKIFLILFTIFIKVNFFNRIMLTNLSNIELISMDGFISMNSDPIDNLYIALIQCFGIILCG